MRALILVGGKGTRLTPVLSDVPKPLAPVEGRPFLSYVLDRLASAGVDETILLTGHMAEKVAALYDGTSLEGMRVSCVAEDKPLGTAGALRNLSNLCRQDPLLLLNGDTWVHFDLTALQAAMERLDAELVLSVVRLSDVSASGFVEQDAEGRLLRFSEKVARGSGLINTGVYLVTDRFVDRIPPGSPISLEAEVIPTALAKGAIIGLSECPGPFHDIGTPEGYRDFCHAAKTGII